MQCVPGSGHLTAELSGGWDLPFQAWALREGMSLPPAERVSFSTDKDPFTDQVLYQWGHFFLTCVKTNQQKPHLKWSQEARRENSLTRHSTHTADPNRKTGRYFASATASDTTLLPSRGKNSPPHPVTTAQLMGGRCNSAYEKSLQFQVQFPPMDPSMTTAPLPSSKSIPLCFSGLAHGSSLEVRPEL